jgi:hypothetical protein
LIEWIFIIDKTSLIIRPIEQNDGESCGYEAHKAISLTHGYPSEQPSEEFGIEFIRRLLDNPNSWGVLAARHSKTLGAYFFMNFRPHQWQQQARLQFILLRREEE